MTDEEIIRNIPASVLSDIENIDKAIGTIANMAFNDVEVDWDEVLGCLQDARSAMIYMAQKHDQLTVQLQEHTVSEEKNDDSIILTTPDQMQAFAFLQVYYKLKMEVERPNGPRWRESPLKQACQILMRANVPIERRTRKWVFPVYKSYLISIGVLQNTGD